MSGGLRHPDWYLISDQKFRQRGALKLSYQTFRGENFVVISDTLTGQYLRLSQRAEVMWNKLDGKRNIQAVFDELSDSPGTATTQHEVVDWIMQLVGSGVLLSDHDLDPKSLSERGQKKRDKNLEMRAASPLSIKIEMFDPNWLIQKTFPLFAWLFTAFGGFVIVGILVTGLALAVLNAEMLAQSSDGALLSQSGLIALALAYPVMKILHELAHGYAVHRFGGEVREFGVMLLIFFPVPYVEASEASAFPDKRARMLVGAAGILAELVIAAISMILWLQIEPGFERAVLFNFMLIGSISTLFFNGNPLLKFDAYFVLADWLEMPNLATRAGAYMSDVFLSVVLRLRREVFPGPGEASILGIYGVLSLIYRLILTMGIALIVSRLFYAIGILLAIWAVVMSIVWPLVKLAKKGSKMARAQNRSFRYWRRLVGLCVTVVGLFAFVPLPFMALGEGQITVVRAAEIRAGTSGHITEIAQLVGAEGSAQTVRTGNMLMQLENPTQSTRAVSLKLDMHARADALGRGGLSVTQRQEQERNLVLTQKALDDVTLLEDARNLTSPADGQLSWAGGVPPVVGSFVFRGDLLGDVIARDTLEVQLAFPAAFAGIIPLGIPQIDMRLPNGDTLTQIATRTQIIAPGQQAPPALFATNGGTIPQLPNAPDLALDAAYLVWIAPDLDLSPFARMRVKARIELPRATAFEQARFQFRRLFLRANRV